MFFFVRRFQLSVEEVVPIRRLVCCLFSIFFCFGFDGMGENYIFCRLVSPLLLWCLFPLLCCLLWTPCGVVFCLQMYASCRKAEFSLGLGILILGLSYPGFFLFLYENILYLHFSFPLVYLFFLFFSLFFPVFRFYQYAWMVPLFLSDFFLVCSIPSLSAPSFFSIVYLYINIDF